MLKAAFSLAMKLPFKETCWNLTFASGLRA
jgi:hypothetical protein